MPDGPIQVVLQPETFREDRQRMNGGGAGKDFFRDRDEEFAAHRDELSGVLRAMSAREGEQRINVAAQMRPDALAKSHRPFRSIFRPSIASHVGSGRYGELIFAVTAADLRRIIELVENAEIEVVWRADARGVLRYSPSPARSELSAIESLREWNPAEARGFTLDEAEAWLTANPSARAEVELFDMPAREVMRSAAVKQLLMLADSFATNNGTFTIPRLTQFRDPARLALERTRPKDVRAIRTRSVDSRAFREGLAALEASSLVKRVALGDVPGDPPSLVDAVEVSFRGGATHSGASRPVVGVVDGGVDWPDLDSEHWIVGHADYLAVEHQSVRRVVHGTTIASLVAIGAKLNPTILKPEEDCRVFDLGLFPAQEYWQSYYPTPLEDFFEVLRESVELAKNQHGAKVFNFSYNFEKAPGASSFSPIARALDRIATDLDVIFVISAGNLPPAELRDEWPASESEAVTMIARTRTPDGLGVPAESLANVSVGASNPPGMAIAIEGAPTRYTRRAKPVPSALKPDFGAPGGGVPVHRADTSGLTALSSSGNEIEVEGTSYAAPLVSRYLASLDAAIAGDIPREVLIGLATHHARLPPILGRSNVVADLGRSFVGRGLLPSVADTLDGSAHRMTLVLSDFIQPGKRVMFNFQWPSSLTTPEGKCRGKINLTLVAQPTLKYAHGDEAVRVNVDGAIRQLDPDTGAFKGQVKPVNDFISGYTYANERTLMTELGKWFPVKSFERTMRGVGKSSEWLLEIGYLTRAAEALPDGGVRFAAILTIEDPSGLAPVHDEMRASLTTIGVSLNDLRAWTSVGVRA